MSGGFGPPFLIGIDVGTQSVRALAFDARGDQVAQARRPTPENRIAPDRLEYDPEAMFTAVVECLGEVARALGGRPVAGIAVASIGESCVLVDEGGRPLAPSIVWHDTRTLDEAQMLRDSVGVERVFEITGLQLDHIFTLNKLMWMRKHWPDAVARTHKVLMIADWIAFRLSGVAATDPSLASRTLYLDLRHRKWSDALFDLAGFDASVLPPLKASGTALGPVRPDILAATGLAGTPVVGVGAHDHVCGAMAAGMDARGTMVDSLGTAEALILAVEQPSFDPMLPRLNLFQGAFEAHRSLFFVGAAVAYSGGAVEWLRGLVGKPPHETLIAEGEAVRPGGEGLIFLPHMVGATSSDPAHPVRGAFIGLTDSTTRGALYRAVLEGLAMRSAFVADAMAGISGVPAPERIRLISGGARNPLLAAIKANTFGRPVTVVDAPEATALGAALLGGVAGGLWPDLDVALATLDRREHVVEPDEKLVSLYQDDTARRLRPDAVGPVAGRCRADADCRVGSRSSRLNAGGSPPPAPFHVPAALGGIAEDQGSVEQDIFLRKLPAILQVDQGLGRHLRYAADVLPRCRERGRGEGAEALTVVRADAQRVARPGSDADSQPLRCGQQPERNPIVRTEDGVDASQPFGGQAEEPLEAVAFVVVANRPVLGIEDTRLVTEFAHAGAIGLVSFPYVGVHRRHGEKRRRRTGAAQIIHHQRHARSIVGADIGHPLAQARVHEEDRHLLHRLLDRGRVGAESEGGHGDPGNVHRHQSGKCPPLQGAVVVGTLQHGEIAAILGVELDRADQFAEERIDDRRHDDADGARRAAREIGGKEVRAVAVVADAFLDQLARTRAHRIGIGEKARHGRTRQSDPASEVLHGVNGVSAHR